MVTPALPPATASGKIEARLFRTIESDRLTIEKKTPVKRMVGAKSSASNAPAIAAPAMLHPTDSPWNWIDTAAA